MIILLVVTLVLHYLNFPSIFQYAGMVSGDVSFRVWVVSSSVWGLHTLPKIPFPHLQIRKHKIVNKISNDRCFNF